MALTKKKLFLENTAFCAVFIAVCLFLNFHKSISYSAKSMHAWRQSDCLSFTSNYAKGNSFLHPELHNLLNTNGKSGYSVSEFPVVYYLVGNLWKLFGKSEMLFRSLTLLVTFAGLFYLFRLYRLLEVDFVFSMIGTFILFSFPFFNYYSNSFLPNTYALSFVFIGWYYFIRYCQLPKARHLILAFSFFTLAGLLKITSALSLAALLTAIIVFNRQDLRKKINLPEPFFNKRVVYYLFGALVVIGSWYVFALKYNSNHGGSFSGSHPYPIWEMTKAEFKSLNVDWFKQIYPKCYAYLFFVIIGLAIAWHKRLQLLWLISFIIMLTGVSVYLLLWFRILSPHDYYWIDALVLVPFVFILMKAFLETETKGMRTFISIVFAVFVLFGLSHSRKIVYDRYFGWIGRYECWSDRYVGIDKYLNSIGVSKTARIISYPDVSTCITLYQADRSGWSELNILWTKEDVRQKIEWGASVFLFGDKKATCLPQYKDFIGPKIGEYNGIAIYRILNNGDAKESSQPPLE